MPKINKQRGEKKCIEYKINNKNAAIVPKALFDIVRKTNSSIIPIINIRQGFIINYLKVYKPIVFNRGSNPVIEYERMLKEIYDLLLKYIRANPMKLEPSIWCLFREYVKDDTQIKEIDYDFKISDVYKPKDDDFVHCKNKKKKYVLLLKINNFKIIKVDEFTINIFKHIRRNNKIPAKFLRKEKEDNIKMRIDYLLKTGFIDKV